MLLLTYGEAAGGTSWKRQDGKRSSKRGVQPLVRKTTQSMANLFASGDNRSQRCVVIVFVLVYYSQIGVLLEDS